MVSDYDKLKAKYKLPKISDLEEKFEISLKEDSTLQSIRNDITEKLYDIIKTLEALIFVREGSDPDLLYIEKMITNLITNGFELYKKVNSLYFSGIKLKFKHDRKKDSDFIKLIFREWDKIEETMLIILEAIEEGWKNIDGTNGIKEEIYHG